MEVPSPALTRFLLLCCLWYMSSAMSSNTGKAILNQYRYPVTLTFIQFGFVAGWCLVFASPLVRFTTIRKPNRHILRSTFPMAVFQVGGHIFSSMAISRVPVSTVHTIKALSPLFTVLAYALLFRVRYGLKTYLSLLPLTAGVMLACTYDLPTTGSALGLLCAFGSAVIFVSSNIFFKKIMPSNGSSSVTQTHKLDKLNLLFYSSGTAFLLMIPIWLYSDLFALIGHFTSASITQRHQTSHSIVYYFFVNGTVHFGQNIIAFLILSSTSPVTYSIASLIKRIAVICIAIVWFNQSVHLMQAVGIGLTFTGLWIYHSAKGDVEQGERKMQRVEAAREMLLPSTRAEHRMMAPTAPSSPVPEKQNLYDEPQYVSSGVDRPRLQPHGYAVPPPLSIPSYKSEMRIRPSNTSPTDLYPSPPLSLDSPPDSPTRISVPPLHAERRDRRGTLKGDHIAPPALPRALVA